MRTRRVGTMNNSEWVWFAVCSVAMTLAQLGKLQPLVAQELPPGDAEPVLRLEAGGPASHVTAMAFSPDGRTLYAAGWDKVVQVWRQDRQGTFHLDGAATFRVPLGPGLTGAINALALSNDGAWLAVGGMGVIREGAGFRQPGLILPRIGRMTTEMRLDEGMIYLFNTRTRAVKLLRGHQGAVQALAFAPVRADKPLLLFSAAREPDGENKVGAVRLWNANDGVQLDSLRLPTPTLERFGLSAWHTGAAQNQARCAIAWGDGQFRVWDVAAGEMPEIKTGNFNVTAAWVPDSGNLLTCHSPVGGGKLQLWDVNAAPRSLTDALVTVGLPQTYHYPMALALLPRHVGGRFDLAAVVVRVPQRDEEFRLHLIDLQPAHFGKILAQTNLWTKGKVFPTLAASPDGSSLAVAGAEGHAISVFATSHLMIGRVAPVALRGMGTSMNQVSFVGKEASWGLKLRAQNNEEIVFDLSQPGVVPANANWAPRGPETENWEVNVKGAAPMIGPRLEILHQQAQVGEVILKPDDSVTAVALLPPTAPRALPLLAVAYLDRFREPVLRVYHARTGTAVRQLTGHFNPIRGLAFHANGNLLASTADDQTVCVWSLADLTLGQQGSLEGVAVESTKDGIVVAQVENTSPAYGKLTPGKKISGLRQGDTLQPLPTPFDFYDAMLHRRPGTSVTLVLEGQDQVIELPVGQSIDERKPLFSLFIARGQRAGERVWVGWSPLGPYDRADLAAEKLIGWHFNRGLADKPVAFALAEEYREQYYRPGILKNLVQEADEAKALLRNARENRLPPPQPPQLTIGIVDNTGERASSTPDTPLLLRQPPRGIWLRADDFALDKYPAEAEWRLGNGPWQSFGPRVGHEWSTIIPILPQKTAVHEFQARFRTAGEHAGLVRSASVIVRQQPPAPIVEIPRGPVVQVDQPEFLFRADVTAGAKNLRLRTTVIHEYHGEQKSLKAVNTADNATIEEKLQLQPGRNLIQVNTIHKDALAGHEDAERASANLEVVYTPPKMIPAPRVALKTFAPIAVEDSGSFAVREQEVMEVRAPKIWLEGEIVAEEMLTEATWSRELAGKTDQNVPVTDFISGKQKSLKIRELLTLEPGKQTFRFRARTPLANQVGEAKFTVMYKPPLPTLTRVVRETTKTMIAAAGSNPVATSGDLIAGVHEPEITMEWHLRLPQLSRPFDAKIIWNKRELPIIPRAINDEGNILRAKIPLTPGANSIRLWLRNEWDQTGIGTEEQQINYRRPPRLLELKRPEKIDKPFVTLVARVQSPKDLPLRSARFQSDGPARTGDFPEKVGAEGDNDIWEITLSDYPLNPGNNLIHFSASNDDGAALEPLKVGLRYELEPPKPPVVELIEPARNHTTTLPAVPVRFRVRSETQPRNVTIFLNGRLVHKVPLDNVKQTSDGFFVEYQHQLPLFDGENQIEVLATNDKSQHRRSVLLTYSVPPVGLAEIRVEPTNRPGDYLTPTEGEKNTWLLPPLNHARYYLQGKVVWQDPQDKRLDAPARVRVWVNGFQQLPTELRPRTPGSLERKFRLEVVMNQFKQNQVEIKLPDSISEIDNRNVLLADCRDPEQRQRLHLLIVGVGMKKTDGEKLKTRVLEALGAELKSDRSLTTTAFSTPGRLYGPLLENVTRGTINYQLVQIRNAIANRARGTNANDVVMVYYHGKETFVGDTHYFETSESLADPHYPELKVNCDALAALFAETPGIQLLFLDVSRLSVVQKMASADRVAQWREDSPHVAVMRTSWTNVEENRGEDSHLASAILGAQPDTKSLSDLRYQLVVRFDKMRQNRETVPLFESRLPDVLGSVRLGSDK